MLAEIITIGDEILIGQIIDTNSAWLGRELNALGVDIIQITTVRDAEEDILKALESAEHRAELILITGGLGPTKDDLTKESLLKYFNTGLKQDPITLENLKKIFEKRDPSLLEINTEQSMVPANCIPIPNTKGTAPGMYFEERDKIFVSMPGVPYEMKAMMENFVFPRLATMHIHQHIVHRTITVVNIPESLIAEKIKDIEEELPSDIKLAYLPHLNLVRLRLSGRSENRKREELKADIDAIFLKIQNLLGDTWFEGDHNMSAILGNMLCTQKMTVGTIESCSGGNVAHNFTIIPGSSAYFIGGMVTYANEQKTKQLGVTEDLFYTVGSVSREVAEEMAMKGKKKLGVDYCISTTGIAGPTGATDTKPVGLVYIGLAKPDGSVIVKENFFRGSRELIIERTAYTAMEMLRQELKTNLHLSNLAKT